MQKTIVVSNLKIAALFFIAVLLFTPGFYRNQWNAAGKKWFYDWKKYNEVMLIARLVWSRQEGIFSDSALFGVGDGQWPLTQELDDHQYETYLSNGTFDTYWIYNSMIGLQGIVFSWIDEVTDFDPAINLKLFRGMTSLLSAIIFALIVCWFFAEFGFLPAAFALVFIMVSEWLALYGGSIFFQVWAFYVPMLAIAMYFYRVKGESNIHHGALASVAVLSVIAKCLFSGFEFITPALAMTAVPVVYYAILRKWKPMTFLVVGINLVLSALIGTLISLSILAFQISSATGGFKEAWSYLIFTFGKRAGGDPTQYSGNIAESLQANVWSVIWRYVSEGRAIYAGNMIHTGVEWLQNYLEIGFYQLFILFAFFSLLFLLISFWRKALGFHIETTALLCTMWFSVLPPISWFIIFKAHSYIHTQLDYIVWQMPFTIFGFAFCGKVIQDIFWHSESSDAIS